MTIDTACARFPILTTKRLRQLQPTDAAAIFAIRSDREVMESYGRKPYQSLDEAYAVIQRLQAIYDQEEAIFWGIRSNIQIQSSAHVRSGTSASIFYTLKSVTNSNAAIGDRAL